MRIIKSIIFLLLFFYPLTILGQGEANNWYFGDYAGITFNTTPPTALTNSAMSTLMGCATISNTQGELLFYTDGSTVYNKNNTVMENGSGLWGNGGSTQSGVIVPKPGSNTIYYVFTVEIRSPSGARMAYSEIDLSFNNGLGKVVNKNNLLQINSAEKITAINRSGTNDIWVIGRELYNNRYNVFLVSASEVAFYHSQDIGVILTEWHMGRGYMKVSPDGKMLAVTHNTAGIVELFNFESSIGELSNLRTLECSELGSVYGVEFSPNGSLLYTRASNMSHTLVQFDITHTSSNDIINSKSILDSQSIVECGALQLGPNGKIYSIERAHDHLGVIENPNTLGFGAGYVKDAIYLEGKECGMGLPTFIQSYFELASFINSNTCEGQATVFALRDITEIDSVRWFFNDPAQPEATSAAWEPSFIFSAAGVYDVDLVYYYTSPTASLLYDTVTQPVTIHHLPNEFNFGSSQNICQGESATLTLNGSELSTNYTLWRNTADSITTLAGTGNALSFTNLTQAGTYSIIAQNDTTSCEENMSGSPEITINPLPQLYDFAQTATICSGETTALTLSGSELGTSYHLVKGGTTLQTLVGTGNALLFENISQMGSYTVVAESPNGCEATMNGTATVVVGDTPTLFTVGGGGSTCQNSGDKLFITLNSSETGVEYTVYQNGNPTTIILNGTGSALQRQLTMPGTYTIEAENTNSSCKAWMEGEAVIEIFPRPGVNRIRRRR